MERDKVALGQELSDWHRLRPRRGNRLGRRQRVADQHAAAAGNEPADDAPTNPAEADHAAGHAGERAERWGRGDELPASVVDEPALRHDLPREGEDEGERVIGDLVDAVVGDVADGNAAGPRRNKIDIVDADPVADDHPGPLHRRNDVGIHRGKLRDHGIGSGDRRGQLNRILRLGDDEAGPRRNGHPLFYGEVGKGMVSDDDLHGGHPAASGFTHSGVHSASAADRPVSGS